MDVTSLVLGKKYTDEKVTVVEQDLATHKADYTSQRATDKFIVATLDKELDDYQRTLSLVNVNQEVKQSVTGYGIVSLPKTSANGQSGISLKGRTLKNELNYNRDTWAEWEKTLGVVGGSEGIEITGDGVIVPSYKLTTMLKPNIRYGVLFQVVSNNTTQSVYMSNNLTGGYIQLSYPDVIGNGKNIFITQNVITINNFKISTTIIIPNGLKFKMKDFRLFELPTGSEIETDFTNLTADQLAVKYPYIKGDKVYSTVSVTRLKSVGKNLFDGTYTKDYYVASTGILSIDADWASTDYIKIEANKQYIQNLSMTLSGLARCAFYDKNKNFISALNANTYTIPVNAYYIRTCWKYSVSGYNFQLEQNTIVTPYEAYTESISYLPNVQELKSLPNGTKDEVRVSGGVAEKVKRVEYEYILKSTDMTGLDIVTNSNLDFVVVPMSKFLGVQIQNVTLIDGSFIIENFGTEIGNIGNSSISIPYSFRTSANEVNLYVPKGTYSNLTTAQTALAGTKITYQLATPIITPIEVSGTLLSNPSGTVYVENVVADANIYASGITILDSTLPIASIDKLSKYSGGMEIELDATLAVINVNKLSFTHPNLVNGDIVFFSYYHSVESTLGETSITYLDSRHTIKDTTNGKYYSTKIVSTNGVATTVLTEVL